jgi:hypothetical protein
MQTKQFKGLVSGAVRASGKGGIIGATIHACTQRSRIRCCVAKRRDLQAGGEVIKVPPADGVGVYTLGENQTAQDLFAMQDELLRSEGIEPPWVPRTEAELAEAEPGRSAISS